MSNITNWLVELYKIAFSEIKLLAELKNQAETDREKARFDELKTSNLLLMVIYSVLLGASIVYIILSFFVAWYSFFILVITIPMIILIKTVQKRRYLKRRDAYIKEDESLIK